MPDRIGCSGLALRALAVSIAGRRLLQGIELDLAAGERACIRGFSGCGKTTLLRTVAGLVDAEAGTIALDGRTPDRVGWPRWRRRVTYVAQQPVLLAGTVRDNLKRVFAYRTATRSWPERVAEQWLARIGLDPAVLRQPAAGLSVGEQQRVALVRALLIDPAVILLDEPTTALDEHCRDAVEQRLLERCRQTGLSVLLVTHEAAQAERLCNKTLDLSAHGLGSGQARDG